MSEKLQLDREEVFKEVVAMIRPYARNKEAIENVTDESRVLEDLGVNSARVIDIVLDFEDKYKVEVDDSAFDRVRTVGDVVELILEKAAGGKY